MENERMVRLDALIGDTLASVPTTKENMDMIMSIETDMHEQLADDERMGWISHEELDVILGAFHKRIHGE
jgi:hypothetical protein